MRFFWVKKDKVLCKVPLSLLFACLGVVQVVLKQAWSHKCVFSHCAMLQRLTQAVPANLNVIISPQWKEQKSTGLIYGKHAVFNVVLSDLALTGQHLLILIPAFDIKIYFRTSIHYCAASLRTVCSWSVGVASSWTEEDKSAMQWSEIAYTLPNTQDFLFNNLPWKTPRMKREDCLRKK